jgi:hypothetical protein
VSFIAKNPHLIESKDRESSVIQTGSILNSILGAHYPLFVTSAHSRQAGSSKDRQPCLPGIGGEPGGPVYRESEVKRLMAGSAPNCNHRYILSSEDILQNACVGFYTRGEHNGPGHFI